MISAMKVGGIKTMVRRLHTIKGEHAAGMARGLKKAGLFLQRKSQEVVPVDTGALKASAFTRARGEGFKTRVDVGYTQSYAIYVHEVPARHKPGKIDKFLELPAKWYKQEIVDIIRREAQRRRGR